MRMASVTMEPASVTMDGMADIAPLHIALQQSMVLLALGMVYVTVSPAFVMLGGKGSIATSKRVWNLW